MARPEREFDWLDDPFDEKKAQQAMGGGSKAFVGIGCALAIVLVIVLVVMSISGLAGLAATM